MTPPPGLHRVALHFNSRAGANSVWVVPEGEGVSGWDTVCTVGLSFPCHTHSHSFLWAWEVQLTWGFGLGGGGASPAVAGGAVFAREPSVSRALH